MRRAPVVVVPMPSFSVRSDVLMHEAMAVPEYVGDGRGQPSRDGPVIEAEPEVAETPFKLKEVPLRDGAAVVARGARQHVVRLRLKPSPDGVAPWQRVGFMLRRTLRATKALEAVVAGVEHLALAQNLQAALVHLPNDLH